MIIIVIFLILAFVTRIPAYAEDYFYDDFSSNTLESNWLIDPGNEISPNSWTINDNRLLGSPTTKKSSLLVLSKSINDPLKNFEISMEVENKGGVDQPIWFRLSEDKNTYYQVDVRYNEPTWQQDHNNITLRKKINGSETILSVYSGTDSGDSEISQNIKHSLMISVKENKITVLFDSIKVIDYFDASTDWIKTGRFGLLNWGGDCSTSTKNYYDNIRIKEILDSKTLRIIIPGLGASWNTEGMLSGSTSPDLSWQMTPFVKNYDNLKESLEDNGLIPNQDYYVWNYDWRLPIDQTVDRFDAFVDSKTTDGQTKVDIIGHSLGGLVGRLWAQKETTKEKVGKIITLGSPHSGAVDAYEAWSGASLSEKDSIGYIALKVLLQLQRRKFLSEMAALKNYAPVLKDLMPTFDYLRMNGQTITPAESNNDYLTANNLTVGEVYGNLEAVGSRTGIAKRWIALGPRDTYETVLGYWPNGKPTSYVWNQGDGTVLWMSSKFEDDSFIEVDSNHGALPDKTINLVLEKLGLTPADPVPVADDFEGKAVFFLGSPATIKVNCGYDDIVSSDFAVTAVKPGSDCLVEVLGTGNGIYHLVSGKVGVDSSWNYFEDEINNGETDSYRFNGQNLELTMQEANADKWWRQLLALVGELKSKYGDYNFGEIDKQLAAKNTWPLTWEIFKLRGKTKEELVTDQAINLLKNILLSETGGEKVAAQTAVIQAMKDMSLCDRETRLYRNSKDIFPTEFAARNYKSAESGYKAARLSLEKEVYSGAEIEAKLASFYLKMVWN